MQGGCAVGDNEFGKKISSLRKSKGLTQAYVAKELGVTPAAVSKWESGASKPRVEILFRLAQILDVNAEDLFAQENEEQASPELQNSDAVPAKTTRRKKFPLIISAVVVACVAVAIVMIVLFTKKTTVPDMAGMNCIEAEEKLNELGLEYRAVGEYNDTVPQNIVISQDIEAGTKVEKKSTVVLTVSKGRQRIPMPQVEDFPVEYGVKLLKDLGFNVVVNTCYDKEYEDGFIVTQSIPIGDAVYKGTIVHIFVNKIP